MWVWFHLGHERLPKEVAEQIGPGTILSAISVWEVLLLFQKGRLESGFSPEDTVDRWLRNAPLRISPIDKSIAILARTLPFSHDDPADRFIAATAHCFDARLATADQRLKALPWLQTLP